MPRRPALLFALASLGCMVFAQTGPQPAGKNIKELPWGVNTQKIMAGFSASLGVQCTYCHVQGDFASDGNPKKEIAREMIRLMRDINYRFPDSKLHVMCYTCHRGETTPKSAPAPGGSTEKGSVQ
jgi:hypothetical protein